MPLMKPLTSNAPNETTDLILLFCPSLGPVAGDVDENSMPSWANSDSWLVDDEDDERGGGGKRRAVAPPSRAGEVALAISGPPGCGKTAAVVACAQVKLKLFCGPTPQLWSIISWEALC